MRLTGWVVAGPLLLAALCAHAQVPVPGQGGVSGSNIQSSPFSNPVNQGITGQSPFATDTSAKGAATKKKPRRLLSIYPEAIRSGQGRSKDTTAYELKSVHFWDEVDTLPGFVQSLGQVGKPYQRFKYGLPDYYLSTPLYHDPLTGRADVYLLNPATQVPFYDTRSPYARAAFSQGAKQQQFFTAEASQNITPFWNMTALYRRRTAQGAYLANITDHYNLALSSNLHSFDDRYQGLITVTFNQLKDGLNGGDKASPTTSEDSLFQKELQPLRLPTVSSAIVPSSIGATANNTGSPGATLFRKVRTLYTLHSYQLYQSYRQQVHLIFAGTINEHARRYKDKTNFAYKFPDINSAVIRPYGTIYDTSRISLPSFRGSLYSFEQAYLVHQYMANGAARHTLELRRVRWSNQFELEFAQLNAIDSAAGGARVHQTKETTRLQGRLQDLDTNQVLALNYTGWVAHNNVLKPETYYQVQGVWAFPRLRYSLQDTIWKEVNNRWVQLPVLIPHTYTPFLLSFEATNHSRNPSLYNTRWHEYTFRANTSLGNEQVSQLNATVGYTGKPRTRGGNPFQQNYVRLTGFNSRISNYIYTDAANQVQQQGRNYLQWQGITLAARGRLDRFYLEGSATHQQSSTNDKPHLGRYLSTQPTDYARASLTYFNKLFRAGKTFLRVGLEGYLFKAYNPLYFDPSNQSWYPLYDYKVRGYIRLDFVAEAQVKDALVFIRFIHLNEGVQGVPGYFTTPFYPMLERTFSFGFSWRFYN